MNIIETIEANYITFSPKEQLVATYLLQEQNHLGNISIQELSSEIGVSAATITRFCRKVGCASYVELKMALQSNGTLKPEIAGDSAFNIVTSFYNRVIERTAELMDDNQIKQIMHTLMKANRIMIYGIGSSGLTAREFAIRLSRMGLNAIAETDAHMMIIGSALTQEGDVVIGFSNSGETKEVVHALKNARSNKSRVISVTSIKGSSITKHSDDIIFVHSSRFVNNEHFVNSQLPFYYLIDLITLELLEDPILAVKMRTTIEEIVQNMKLEEENK